jgi:hypothetical protein
MPLADPADLLLLLLPLLLLLLCFVLCLPQL